MNDFTKLPCTSEEMIRLTSFPGSPNVAMVTVTVGDENDNPPRFVYSPVIVGVPHDAKINYLVTVLEASPFIISSI